MELRLSKTPADKEVSRFELSSKVFKDPRSSKTPAGKLVSWLLSRYRRASPVRPEKSLLCKEVNSLLESLKCPLGSPLCHDRIEDSWLLLVTWLYSVIPNFLRMASATFLVLPWRMEFVSSTSSSSWGIVICAVAVGGRRRSERNARAAQSRRASGLVAATQGWFCGGGQFVSCVGARRCRGR